MIKWLWCFIVGHKIARFLIPGYLTEIYFYKNGELKERYYTYRCKNCDHFVRM